MLLVYHKGHNSGTARWGRCPGKVWEGVWKPTPSPGAPSQPSMFTSQKLSDPSAWGLSEGPSRELDWLTPARWRSAASPARWSCNGFLVPAWPSHSPDSVITQRSRVSGAGARTWTSTHSGCPIAPKTPSILLFGARPPWFLEYPAWQVSRDLAACLLSRFCVSAPSHVPGLALGSESLPRRARGHGPLLVPLRPDACRVARICLFPAGHGPPAPLPQGDPTQREAAVPQVRGGPPTPRPPPAWPPCTRGPGLLTAVCRPVRRAWTTTTVRTSCSWRRSDVSTTL